MSPWFPWALITRSQRTAEMSSLIMFCAVAAYAHRLAVALFPSVLPNDVRGVYHESRSAEPGKTTSSKKRPTPSGDW